ncbi:tail fiber protein [Photorhabdus luminescens]|uniref:Phage tail collar domain-containing protein n=1 Tax=Photorhabdus luminescens subsp. mexicana TaxID=2100167 RepID=A0A4R4JH45_PHOLU|nr:tail fiber protein [Photorhabdus luminescens]TDB53537.1 hypothetical protein C5468_07600 [Photorhabdus luminescens subsp. mexicana]
MEKKHELSDLESSKENTNIKSIGPSADDLKSRFKEGSIPLQTDYADLIDIADIGRRATGQAPGQSGKPGDGLSLTDDGTLQTTLNSTGGLLFNNKALSIKPSNGINIDDKGVSIKLANRDCGLTVNNDGLAILNHDDSGLLRRTDKGLQVKASNGINVDTNGVSVKIGNGITVDNNGVSIKASNGITVDSNGVSIDSSKVLPRGMIVMFSGNNVPTGWALCDGNNGTPNLIDRFILGGSIANIGGASRNIATGQKDTKSFIVNSGGNPTQIMDVRVNDTILNLDQIPYHQHMQGGGFTTSSGLRFGSLHDDSNGLRNLRIINNESGEKWTKGDNRDHHWPYTNAVGGGRGHNHTASTTLPVHTHQVDTMSPYYILAFMMKL